jgi:hypothetical protein
VWKVCGQNGATFDNATTFNLERLSDAFDLYVAEEDV